MINNTFKTKNYYISFLILATSIACCFYYNNFWILIVNVCQFYWLYQIKFNYKLIILIIVFSILCFALCLLIHKNFNTHYLITNLEKECDWSLRKQIIVYLSKKYLNKNTLMLIKLMIFNEKVSGNFKQILYDLNIAHLFIVSGLHLNIFLLIINKIFFKKWPKISFVIGICFLIFYGYLLEFSIGFIRVFIMHILSIKFFQKISKMDKLAISGLIIASLSIYNLSMLSFIFAYLALFCIYLLNLFIKDNSILKNIYINLYILSITFIISINLNEKINFLSIIFGYVMNLPILFVYQVLFWFMFIPHFEVVLDGVTNILVKAIYFINEIDANIYIKNYSEIITIFYTSIWLTISLWIYYKKILKKV
ncbi:ComEC/Rec2 family competence protein [Ureaplasma urealyticum]|uniref:ComEC family DNA internalization-related competence protein n=3 Tax=Ureaplasma urealyticum TaxID=2130 RepID=A0AAP9D7P2_UREUR|nr:ComEC/Rec2 family competence protein [Ureaplasma urealyticum]EDX53736.1 ComEC/Rec2 family protein [Ureaplasma urealyticum serovar 9 str. ATCC 33175]EDU06287.1 ComEC/Rec2 family protein [Ureaplasma urealyticum serovar 5 str. ATCC 27817]EDX53331.1 ComEC/Rec2 family protein [Ureaplasma urealyticum serovar 12 str. ATCC 33696]EDY74359.1 ComEC/Rec2 family protein [Ureaplasma urealyticum serovar 4 str. ATCC 27816]EEH01440.1 ComEC/Rec2 family protein [Ureaplasma urealyticum serovar 8 str. ATCC 2761